MKALISKFSVPAFGRLGTDTTVTREADRARRLPVVVAPYQISQRPSEWPPATVQNALGFVLGTPPHALAQVPNLGTFVYKCSPDERAALNVRLAPAAPQLARAISLRLQLGEAQRTETGANTTLVLAQKLIERHSHFRRWASGDDNRLTGLQSWVTNVQDTVRRLNEELTTLASGVCTPETQRSLLEVIRPVTMREHMTERMKKAGAEVLACVQQGKLADALTHLEIPNAPLGSELSVLLDLHLRVLGHVPAEEIFQTLVRHALSQGVRPEHVGRLFGTAFDFQTLALARHLRAHQAVEELVQPLVADALTRRSAVHLAPLLQAVARFNVRTLVAEFGGDLAFRSVALESPELKALTEKADFLAAMPNRDEQTKLQLHFAAKGRTDLVHRWVKAGLPPPADSPHFMTVLVEPMLRIELSEEVLDAYRERFPAETAGFSWKASPATASERLMPESNPRAPPLGSVLSRTPCCYRSSARSSPSRRSRMAGARWRIRRRRRCSPAPIAPTTFGHRRRSSRCFAPRAGVDDFSAGNARAKELGTTREEPIRDGADRGRLVRWPRLDLLPNWEVQRGHVQVKATTTNSLAELETPSWVATVPVPELAAGSAPYSYEMRLVAGCSRGRVAVVGLLRTSQIERVQRSQHEFWPTQLNSIRAQPPLNHSRDWRSPSR